MERKLLPNSSTLRTLDYLLNELCFKRGFSLFFDIFKCYHKWFIYILYWQDNYLQLNPTLNTPQVAQFRKRSPDGTRSYCLLVFPRDLCLRLKPVLTALCLGMLVAMAGYSRLPTYGLVCQRVSTILTANTTI